MPSVIKAVDLTRKFESKVVFENISLEIQESEKVVLVGDNGSGKTTLLRTLANLISPTSGQVIIAKNLSIGWVSGNDKGLVPIFTGLENLQFLGALHGLSKSQVSLQIEELSEIESLSMALKTPFYQCSLGMKQSLKLVASLIAKPDILFWDEPFKSLDDHSLIQFRIRLAQKLRHQTVLMAVPSLRDVDGFAYDQKFQMSQGKLLV